MDKQKRSKPTVVGNGVGGLIHTIIEPPINDREYGIKIVQDDKEAFLRNDIGTIMELSECGVGYQFPGKIITKEFLKPIDNDDELRYLKIKDGKFCKKGEQYIWSYSYYTHDQNEFDEIIQED